MVCRTAEEMMKGEAGQKENRVRSTKEPNQRDEGGFQVEKKVLQMKLSMAEGTQVYVGLSKVAGRERRRPENKTEPKAAKARHCQP